MFDCDALFRKKRNIIAFVGESINFYAIKSQRVSAYFISIGIILIAIAAITGIYFGLRDPESGENTKGGNLIRHKVF